MSERVAIYAIPGAGGEEHGAGHGSGSVAPPANPGRLLRRLAEAWLADPAVADITIDARRYGFHGTLKAPFRVREGHTIAEIEHAVAEFASARGGVTIPSLRLELLSGFFALTAGEETPALNELAREIVARFDTFRAPATEAEIARRQPHSLSERQRTLLEAWGYPYVFNEFRFHLTLTDRIPAIQQVDVRATLEHRFAPCIGSDIALDALAVVTEAAPGAPFQLRSLHPFSTPTFIRTTAESVL